MKGLAAGKRGRRTLFRSIQALLLAMKVDVNSNVKSYEFTQPAFLPFFFFQSNPWSGAWPHGLWQAADLKKKTKKKNELLIIVSYCLLRVRSLSRRSGKH